MKEKLSWIMVGGTLIFVLSFLSGGIYTITAPNGPVDTAYKINRFTGQVWLIKTYTKQLGPLHVLAARQADVEKTKEITEADVPSVALNEPFQPSKSGRNR